MIFCKPAFIRLNTFGCFFETSTFSSTSLLMSKDVEEKVDVSKKHPKVFNRMKAGLQKIINDGRSRP